MQATVPLFSTSSRPVHTTATDMEPASVFSIMVAGLAAVTLAIIGSGATTALSAEVVALEHLFSTWSRPIHTVATEVDPACVFGTMVGGLAAVTQAILGSGATRETSAEVLACPHVSMRQRSRSRTRSRSPTPDRRTTIVSHRACRTQDRDARLTDTAGTSHVPAQELLAVGAGSFAVWRLYRSRSTGQPFWYNRTNGISQSHPPF